MSKPVTDINIYKKIKMLERDLVELKEVSAVVKSTMNSLTKFNKFYTIKKNVGHLMETYQNIKNAIRLKEDMLLTLQIRKDHE